MKPKYYLEAHITIEPLTPEKHAEATKLCEQRSFKIAEFLMQDRTPGKDPNSFISCRETKSLDIMVIRVAQMVWDLRAMGVEVRRYKIEDTLVDSRHEDSLDLMDLREEKTKAVCSADGCSRTESCGPFCRDRGNL